MPTPLQTTTFRVPAPAAYSAGPHDVYTTLESPDSQGWVSYGAGPCGVQDDSPYTSNISGEHATVLRWNGSATGEPVVHARGSYWRMGDLTIVGWPTTVARNAALALDPPGRGAETGIWVYHPGGNFNGSKATLENVSFAHLGAAVLLGNRNESPHSGDDNLTINKPVFAHVDAGVAVDTNQAVTTSISDWLLRVGTLVECRNGSDVTVTRGDMRVQDRLFYVSGDSSNIAGNNGFLKAETIKIDQSTQGATLRLLEWDDAVGLNASQYVTISDVRGAALATNQIWRVQARGADTLVRLDDCKNMRFLDFELHDGCQVVVSNTRVSGGAYATVAALEAGCINPASTGGQVYFQNCFIEGQWRDVGPIAAA